MKEYLDQHQLNIYFEDVVAKLLEETPDTPLDFISEYFSKCKTGENTLNREFRYVRASISNRIGFINQFNKIVVEKNEDFSLYELQHLLELICKDFPLEVTETAVKIAALGKKIFNYSSPTFDTTLSLRESGIGHEKLPFKDFIQSISKYFGYIDFFENSITLLEECNSAIQPPPLTKTIPNPVEQLKSLEETYKVNAKRLFAKNLASPVTYARMKDVIERVFKMHQGSIIPNFVPSIWFEMTYQIIFLI